MCSSDLENFLISVYVHAAPFSIYHGSDDRLVFVPHDKGLALKEKAVGFAYSLSYLDISEYIHVRIGIADQSCRGSDSMKGKSVPRTWLSGSWLL